MPIYFAEKFSPGSSNKIIFGFPDFLWQGFIFDDLVSVTAASLTILAWSPSAVAMSSTNGTRSLFQMCHQCTISSNISSTISSNFLVSQYPEYTLLPSDAFRVHSTLAERLRTWTIIFFITLFIILVFIDHCWPSPSYLTGGRSLINQKFLWPKAFSVLRVYSLTTLKFFFWYLFR